MVSKPLCTENLIDTVQYVATDQNGLTATSTRTDCFRPRWKRPVNLSPISDAMDLDGAPLQENRRANPANAPCL
jgi:hypothetical protein